MSRFVWKDQAVYSLNLKDGSYVLLQLLKSPYVVFFKNFAERDSWSADATEVSEPLFFCAVARQFVKASPLARQSKIRPRVFERTPEHWIKRFPGSRRVTIWKGEPNEATFIALSARPGGSLVEVHIDQVGFVDMPVIVPSIDLKDDATIDAHEMDVIWLYPSLNERLLLCKQLGSNADPEKDVTFDRPIRKEYATYVDILAGRGSRTDWGYAAAKDD